MAYSSVINAGQGSARRLLVSVHAQLDEMDWPEILLSLGPDHNMTKNKGCIDGWKCSFFKQLKLCVICLRQKYFFTVKVTAQYLAFCEADWPQVTNFSLSNEWWKKNFTIILFLSFSACTLSHPDVWHIEVCCWTGSRYGWRELSLWPKFTTSVADCFCVFYFARKATILSAHTHHCVTLM